jgi:hypothetical protein
MDKTKYCTDSVTRKSPKYVNKTYVRAEQTNVVGSNPAQTKCNRYVKLCDEVCQ